MSNVPQSEVDRVKNLNKTPVKKVEKKERKPRSASKNRYVLGTFTEIAGRIRIQSVSKVCYNVQEARRLLKVMKDLSIGEGKALDNIRVIRFRVVEDGEEEEGLDLGKLYEECGLNKPIKSDVNSIGK